MELEHETAGGILEKIRELSNNYTLPADACASYSLLYRMLDEFENDLHIHVHLENNILFPKALALEKN
jgi:regulator of cell morphogenesis and NO signaling